MRCYYRKFSCDLLICACLSHIYKVRGQKAEQGKRMTELKVALIVSNDEEIRIRFSGFLDQIQVPYLLESDRTTSIARLMDMDVRVLIVDMLHDDENGLDYLKVVKKLRPRVPIIAITDEIDDEAQNRLLDEGIKYCLTKRMKDQEISDLVSTMMVQD